MTIQQQFECSKEQLIISLRSNIVYGVACCLPCLLGFVYIAIKEDFYLMIYGLVMPMSLLLAYSCLVTYHKAKKIQKMKMGDLDVVKGTLKHNGEGKHNYYYIQKEAKYKYDLTRDLDAEKLVLRQIAENIDVETNAKGTFYVASKVLVASDINRSTNEIVKFSIKSLALFFILGCFIILVLMCKFYM